MVRFANQTSFKLLTSTPYYAQANGQVEATNKNLITLIKKKLEENPREICLQSTSVQRQHEIPVDRYWNMVLDELVDIDEERLKALDVLMRQKERITKFYNKKVKSKTFDVNDLVWKVILPMDKRDTTLGKSAPGWEGPWKILRVFLNNAYEIEELNDDNRIMCMGNT
ncbi:uncharacterized protein [Medicago truncatula]|uniref:uncharacterized protein n=1 Tax=Medicago truncatula TaxID=3880 RepID=UPI000D2F337C|nr:uncharacterized protein LOC112420739 [Medicago truncatula]